MRSATEGTLEDDDDDDEEVVVMMILLDLLLDLPPQGWHRRLLQVDHAATAQQKKMYWTLDQEAISILSKRCWCTAVV